MATATSIRVPTLHEGRYHFIKLSPRLLSPISIPLKAATVNGVLITGALSDPSFHHTTSFTHRTCPKPDPTRNPLKRRVHQVGRRLDGDQRHQQGEDDLRSRGGWGRVGTGGRRERMHPGVALTVPCFGQEIRLYTLTCSTNRYSSWMYLGTDGEDLRKSRQGHCMSVRSSRRSRRPLELPNLPAERAPCSPAGDAAAPTSARPTRPAAAPRWRGRSMASKVLDLQKVAKQLGFYYVPYGSLWPPTY